MNARFPLLSAALMLGLATAPALSQEFRIDTEIFVGKEKEPAAETLTIFKNGLVYDFLLSEPQEITIFDPHRGRFTLLDPARKLKAIVTTQDLLNFAVQFGAQAAQSKNTLFAFAAEPQFATTVEEVNENGQPVTRLKLVGKPLEYLVTARVCDRPQALAQFRDFADWYARLNATRPGNLPPGARLELNKLLAERQLLPMEITRTIPASSPLSRKSEVRSQHLVNWTLSGEDLKRIDRAGEHLVSLPTVGYDEYRTAPAAAAPAKQARR